MTQEYESHPLAQIFPMMMDAELAELAEDIKTNGQAEPIALYDGKILDGRNRYQACQIAGVEPQVTVLEELESPILYVISKNLHRRHLTESQRTAIAAELKPLLKQEMTDRQQQGGKLAGRGRPKTEQVQETFPEPIAPSNSNGLHGQSRDIVGNMLGVSGRNVDKAVAVKQTDPDKFEQIKRGEVSVNAAYKQVKEMTAPARPQDEPKVAAPSKRQQILANAAKKRMELALSQARGTCRVLPGLNIPAIQSLCTRDELTGWIRIARDCAKKLRVLAISLAKETK